jgi:hypothetical protein
MPRRRDTVIGSGDDEEPIMSDTTGMPDGTDTPDERAPERNPDQPDRDDISRDQGLGSEGTIPDEPGSVGVGAGEPTTFEPEEDPEAAANRDADAPT